VTILKSATPIWIEGPAYAPEHMTRPAATMLARRITAYWAKRGHTVKCRVEQLQGEKIDGHGTIHVVRSDMISGMPR
jgi:hypothetical protein